MYAVVNSFAVNVGMLEAVKSFLLRVTMQSAMAVCAQKNCVASSKSAHPLANARSMMLPDRLTVSVNVEILSRLSFTSCCGKLYLRLT